MSTLMERIKTYSENMAFSVIPMHAEAMDNTKPNSPKYTCNGIKAALKDSLAPGAKYAANPITYCKQKIRTADRPNHE